MADEYNILPEHAAPEKDLTNSAGADYSPNPDEKKEIRLVENLFQKAKKFKSQYDWKWLDWYKMFRGRQWKEQRPSYRHSEVLNLIFQTIQSQLPIITDTRPKFEFLPQNPADYELSQILNEVAQADWVKYNWMWELCELLYDGHFYGTGLSEMCFDPDHTCIKYRSAEPFYCFPDPDAKDVNKDSEYFIFAEPMSLTKIKRKWPDKGKFVKADLIDLMRGSKSDIGPVRYKSPIDNRTVFESEGPASYDIVAKDKALVYTVYLKSEEYEEQIEKEIDKETGEETETTVQKLKYPNGKKIVVSNGVLLESGPNPYDHGLFPFQRWQNYVLPREFWGQSEVEQLEGPQKTFNKLVSFVMDCLTLMGNPIWVVDSTSGVDTDNFFNRPGMVVEKEPNSQVQRVEGTQLQPYVMQIIDRYKQWFDQIAGSNDITRGLNPSGVTAASAIENLQNAAQTRIRQKSRNLDCYLQDLGKQYVSLVFQFYTAPQIFRVTGKDGVEKYFKFHTSMDEQTGIRSAFVENLTPEGQSMGINQYEQRAEFDVRVTTGSSLPFSKAEREDQLTKLFQLGIIDQEEVLKGMEYPNYEAVMQRMQQKQAQQAQDQQGQPPAKG